MYFPQKTGFPRLYRKRFQCVRKESFSSPVKTAKTRLFLWWDSYITHEIIYVSTTCILAENMVYYGRTKQWYQDDTEVLLK